MRTNEPNMNITNQINAALNDIRKTLIDLSCYVPGSGELVTEMAILDHTHGRQSQPWSDRKHQVDEEFS